MSSHIEMVMDRQLGDWPSQRGWVAVSGITAIVSSLQCFSLLPRARQPGTAGPAHSLTVCSCLLRPGRDTSATRRWRSGGDKDRGYGPRTILCNRGGCRLQTSHNCTDLDHNVLTPLRNKEMSCCLLALTSIDIAQKKAPSLKS